MGPVRRGDLADALAGVGIEDLKFRVMRDVEVTGGRIHTQVIPAGGIAANGVAVDDAVIGGTAGERQGRGGKEQQGESGHGQRG